MFDLNKPGEETRGGGRGGVVAGLHGGGFAVDESLAGGAHLGEVAGLAGVGRERVGLRGGGVPETGSWYTLFGCAAAS